MSPAKRITRTALRIAASLLVCGLAAGRASAKTLYVSTGGSDQNTGTVSRPLATPRRAVALASPGDVILLGAGTYPTNRTLWIDKPNLTLASSPGERAALRGPASDEKNLQSVVAIVASGVRLTGIEVEGGSYYGVKVDVDQAHSTNGVRIQACRIHDTGRDCIKTFNADDLLIEDCEIGPSGIRDPSDAEGIDSIGSIGVTIRRCYIHDTATNGLYLKGGARNGLVESCRVENTGGFGGILLGQDTDLESMRDGARFEAIDCIARNNIVAHTGAAGLATYSGSNIRFLNNTLYDVAGRLQAGLWVVTNSRNVPAERVTFQNNIVVTSGSRPFVFVKDLAGRLDSDGNLYFNAGGRYQFVLESGAGESRWSLDGWRRTLGVDAHSICADPLLDPAHLYRLKTGSPAIGRGAVLDARLL